VQSSQLLPSEPYWQQEDLRPAERGQQDKYAAPEGDEDWPMLVEGLPGTKQRLGTPLD